MIRKKVVIYLRLSIEDGDGESMSIANQRKILHAYAEDHNMEIVEEYVDDNWSGYLWDRPAFNRLKRDLNNNKIEIILVKDLSRLGRHNAKVQLFLENIEEVGKRVIAPGDGYDTLDERSKDMSGIQTWFNEYYVKNTSKKIRSTLSILQKEGRLLSNVPYGYYKDKNDKTKCHIDQNIAPYIEQIFDMYINGHGVKEIARMLTANNVPTPTMVKKLRMEAEGETCKIKVSGIWDTSVIIKILKNEFYLGTLTLNKTKTRSIHGKKINVEPEEHLKFPNHHEAIIDKYTFQLAQEIRKQRQCNNFRGRKSKVRKNLFAGIIYCADCGQLLTTSGGTANTRYICKTYNVFGTTKCTSHAIMENDIIEVLLDFFEHCKENLQDVLEDIDKIIKAEMKVKTKQDNNIKDLMKMLDNTQKSLEALIELRVKEMVKNPSMSDIIDKTYTEMQNEKYKEIQSLEKQIADQNVISLDDEQMKKNVNVALNIINDVLNSKDITKKQILMLVDKIVVHDDSGIDIYLKGNLHELCNNYFKVNETRMNKTKKYLYEYIASHPDKFTKDECTVYVKDQGVKVHYKIISKIINEDLADMVELRPMRHGYRLTAPIEDVERVLLNNIVVSTAKWFDNNCDIFSVLIKINGWIENLKYEEQKNLF